MFSTNVCLILLEMSPELSPDLEGTELELKAKTLSSLEDLQGILSTLFVGFDPQLVF